MVIFDAQLATTCTLFFTIIKLLQPVNSLVTPDMVNPCTLYSPESSLVCETLLPPVRHFHFHSLTHRRLLCIGSATSYNAFSDLSGGFSVSSSRDAFSKRASIESESTRSDTYTRSLVLLIKKQPRTDSSSLSGQNTWILRQLAVHCFFYNSESLHHIMQGYT